MHLPFLTLMEQLNVISEGSRSRRKSSCDEGRLPSPLSGGVWELSVRSRRPREERSGCEPTARPSGPGQSRGEGSGEGAGSQSFGSGITGSRGSRSQRQGPVPHYRRYWDSGAVCSGGREVKESPLDSGSLEASFFSPVRWRHS